MNVIAIGADNYYIAEGFGCITTHRQGQAAVADPLADISDVFDLEVPDPYKMGACRSCWRIRRSAPSRGRRGGGALAGTGPFALASYGSGRRNG